MVALPRVVIAAPSTGQGKTTVAVGLMAALVGRGLAVSGHKVGPDYIDAGYHALATGRPGRNLDPHLVGEERIVPLLLHGARGADIAVIEGVMGLHDGRLGTDGFASTAHVARLTRSPVVLVVDIGRMARTVGAIVAGVAAWDPEVDVAGIILNRAGSDRQVAEVQRSLGLPVLGVLPRDEALAAPSRHLGLVPAGEWDESAAAVARLRDRVAEHLDLPAMVNVARRAPALAGPAWDPQAEVSAATPDRQVIAATRPERPVVAVAGGSAFTFRYAEVDELLRAAGCDVVTFDPLNDPSLPPGTRGLYIGGGFPEVHAATLAANRSLLADIRAAVSDGLPTVAECAGLLYLARSLDGTPMAGVLAADAVMAPRLTLRYPVATAAGDSLLTRASESVTGHEFHRTVVTPLPFGQPAWVIDGEPVGFASDTLHASYLHVHWAGHPQLAQRFADAVHAARPWPFRPTVSVESADPSRMHPGDWLVLGTDGPAAADAGIPDPLLFHGDQETGAGLLDLAVNVFPGDRPDWLEAALRAGLDRADQYPDPRPARTAVARLHGRSVQEVLPTAGAAEAFELVARLRPWRRPVVVHPQFTEPHAALERAGLSVTAVLCRAEDGFRLDPATVPPDADLVLVGNPTNPTGVLHPTTLLALRAPGRLVVVDEAFMDAVPDPLDSLAARGDPGVLVLRSLTKHWTMPGVRAGYVLGDATVVDALAALQVPWSVSSVAIEAMVACSSEEATVEARRRAELIAEWRTPLVQGLRDRGMTVVDSRASFVLARPGMGVHDELRARGIAVRRADTFPGLDASWVRIAVRPPEACDQLFAALDAIGTLDGAAHARSLQVPPPVRSR